MIPLYILGLLQRFGPQHGYQIKKTIAEQLSDFTQIKLPTIYYHLGKMADNGLLDAAGDKAGGRPEKTVYTITDQGRAAYRNMLSGLLKADYRPAFSTDALFYFSDHFESAEMIGALQGYVEKLNHSLAIIEKHRTETLAHIPDDCKTMVGIIFSHHEHHYHAELIWAEEALQQLIREEKPC